MCTLLRVIVKRAFLSEVARRTGAPARVHNMRTADAASSGAAPIADVVTARALAPLMLSLELALPFSVMRQPDCF